MTPEPMTKDKFDFESRRAMEQLKMFESDQSRCIWCGAELPADREFSEYHMLKVHGLIV